MTPVCVIVRGPGILWQSEKRSTIWRGKSLNIHDKRHLNTQGELEYCETNSPTLWIMRFALTNALAAPIAPKKAALAVHSAATIIGGEMLWKEYKSSGCPAQEGLVFLQAGTPG